MPGAQKGAPADGGGQDPDPDGTGGVPARGDQRGSVAPAVTATGTPRQAAMFPCRGSLPRSSQRSSPEARTPSRPARNRMAPDSKSMLPNPAPTVSAKGCRNSFARGRSKHFATDPSRPGSALGLSSGIRDAHQETGRAPHRKQWRRRPTRRIVSQCWRARSDKTHKKQDSFRRTRISGAAAITLPGPIIAEPELAPASVGLADGVVVPVSAPPRRGS